MIRTRAWDVVALTLAASVLHCGDPAREGAAGTIREAIIGGAAVNSADSPVLFLHSPEGLCTAILIAPNLAATARHCVSPMTDGAFGCTAAGELQPGGQGGQLGADNAPDTLKFYSSVPSHVSAGIAASTPDAIGVRIFSLGATGAPTACRDDIAFIVLDRAMVGLVPAPVRLDTPTRDGEPVSLWGFGFTDEAGAPIALRVRHGVQVIAVGPDVATNLTQPAPVRAVRVGPGSFSCNGDSGGPILSEVTGAVLALVSLGVQANTGPYCTYNADSDTTGPRLAAYRDLARLAFAAAGASPLPEYPPDAGSPLDGAPPPSDGPGADDTMDSTDSTDGTDAGPDRSLTTLGGGAPSCSLVLVGARRSGGLDAAFALACAIAAAAASRRRSGSRGASRSREEPTTPRG